MIAYLDNSSTTKPLDIVCEKTKLSMEQNWGNPSSLHKIGFQSEIALNNSREIIAKSFKTKKDNIFFSSSGTLSNNVAILGSISAQKRRGNHIITTAVEHSAVYNVFKNLENQGFLVTYITPSQKEDDIIKKILQCVTDKTIFISVMMVNNELGQIFPVEDIAREVKRKNKLTQFHTDAVQGYMKFPINLRKSEIDFLSFSGHKIHAPKGIAGLYVKKGAKINPVLFGGGQEKDLFPGTENTSFACGLATAVDELNPKINDSLNYVDELNMIITSGIKEIKDSFINFSINQSPYIISAGLHSIPAEVLLHYLEERNIFVSSGSACSKGKKSRVLSSYGISDKIIDSTIRISLSPYTKKDEIYLFLEEFESATKSLQKRL